MNFSHLDLKAHKNLANDLIKNLLSMEPPRQKYIFDYKILDVDDVLINSKLYTEDDSEEYNRVHSENNRQVHSKFLLTDVD